MNNLQGEVSPYQKVQQLGDKNLFLIHRKADDKIPDETSILIAEQATGNVDLWLPENSGHINSFLDFPDEYERRVLQFLQEIE